MFIAVDDTDSRKGMCTTFLATELIKEFKEFQLLDHPRLVRLNPNVPWKTRGNGAIVLEIGKGEKKKEKLGVIEEDVYLWEGDGDLQREEQRKIFKKVREKVEEFAEFDSKKTNPGIVVGSSRPPLELYEKGVQDVVQIEEIKSLLDQEYRLHKGYQEERGLIGATCALAWRPKDHTYELIAYREKKRWGTEREVNVEDIKNLDEKLKSTFDNYDHEEEKQAIAPRSPCPVLYGIRGEDRQELQKALDIVESEKVERWMTFLTNQGTDDHIQTGHMKELKPWTSVKLKGKVSSRPESIEGGHVLIQLEKNDKEVTAAAYEPTKDFRKIIERLIPGDIVEVYGGVRKEPISINMEKIKILKLEEKIKKISNPECPKCGKNMSSMGRNAGYRCKRCRTKADEDEALTKRVERELKEGWYEVPVSARRHLSKPLKRIKN